MSSAYRLAAPAIAGLSVLIAPVLAQQPQQNTQAASGLILGRVVEATTNAPIRDAIVQIDGSGGNVDMTHHSPAGDSQPLGVMTDAEGQFVFSGLPGGSYRLLARRNGYLEAPYGARRPGSLGTPILLRDREQRGDVVIRLWKYAAITGVVTDEFGDPLVQASVRAYARTSLAGHTKLGMNVAYATTDDRGVYRLSRLIPGDYVVGVIRSERAAPAALIDARQKLLAEANRAEAGALSEALSKAGAYVAPPGTGDSVRLGATLVGLASPVAPAASDGWMSYPTQFYPGAADANAARAISVRSGDQVTGIDFRLRPVRTRTVSGVVAAADGPVARFPVRLLPIGVSDFEMETQAPAHATLTDDSGRFVFPAVPAGDYLLRALRGVGAGSEVWAVSGAHEIAGGVVISSGNFAVVTAEAPPPQKTEPTRYATTPVTVSDRDVTGVRLSLTLGAPVSGRVEFIGRSDRPSQAELRAIGIVVEAVDGRVPGFDFEITGQADSEGRFETVGLPAGRYFIRVPRVPPGWMLESVDLGGRDVSDMPVDVGPSPVAGVTIRLTKQPSVFAGTVRAAGPKDDISRAMVVVFPVDRARWRDFGSTPRRLQDAGLSADGAFEIRGLPAGDYFAAAIQDDFIREWRSPALLERIAQSAIRITIAAGGHASHVLTLTPTTVGGGGER